MNEQRLREWAERIYDVIFYIDRREYRIQNIYVSLVDICKEEDREHDAAVDRAIERMHTNLVAPLQAEVAALRAVVTMLLYSADPSWEDPNREEPSPAWKAARIKALQVLAGKSNAEQGRGGDE